MRELQVQAFAESEHAVARVRARSSEPDDCAVGGHGAVPASPETWSCRLALARTQNSRTVRLIGGVDLVLSARPVFRAREGQSVWMKDLSRARDVNRREFLARAGAVCLGAAGVDQVLRFGEIAASAAPIAAGSTAPGSVLAASASECPVDTVVVVMMENRSFDHYLGWLGDDEVYLDAGRRRYGSSFFVDGVVHQSFPDGLGQVVPTRPADSFDPEKVETRGCSFQDPGHTWDAARVQRELGVPGPRERQRRVRVDLLLG